MKNPARIKLRTLSVDLPSTLYPTVHRELRGWKEPAARSDRELGRGGPCLPPPGSALDPRPSAAYITASALRMGSVI